jgi:hypothetical protein
MQESDQLTSSQFEFVIHGWLEVKLDTVNSRVDGTSSSSNSGTGLGLSRRRRFRGHAELGSSRAWRSHVRAFLCEVNWAGTKAALGSTTSKANNSSCRGGTCHNLTSWTHSLNDFGTSCVGGINGFCVVAEGILSVIGLSGHRSLVDLGHRSTNHETIGPALVLLAEVRKELSDWSEREAWCRSSCSLAGLTLHVSKVLVVLLIVQTFPGLSSLLQAEQHQRKSGTEK